MDDLALMIGRGFAGVDKRFDEVYKRFDIVETRLDTLEGKMDDLDKKVDRIDSRLTNQLDYVMLHYTRRGEHELLSKRVSKLGRK